MTIIHSEAYALRAGGQNCTILKIHSKAFKKPQNTNTWFGLTKEILSTTEGNMFDGFSTERLNLDEGIQIHLGVGALPHIR